MQVGDKVVTSEGTGFVALTDGVIAVVFLDHADGPRAGHFSVDQLVVVS